MKIPSVPYLRQVINKLLKVLKALIARWSLRSEAMFSWHLGLAVKYQKQAAVWRTRLDLGSFKEKDLLDLTGARNWAKRMQPNCKTS